MRSLLAKERTSRSTIIRVMTSPTRCEEKIEAHGRRALSFKVSVTDRYGMKHIAREIKEAWGAINVLVNNAAVNKGDNFATTTDKSWDWVVDTNVSSLFAVTKPFYKQMIRERAGSILNITSVGAIRSLRPRSTTRRQRPR